MSKGIATEVVTNGMMIPNYSSKDDWNRYNSVPGYAASPILAPSVAVDAWAEELEGIVAVGGLFVGRSLLGGGTTGGGDPPPDSVGTRLWRP